MGDKNTGSPSERAAENAIIHDCLTNICIQRAQGIIE